MNDPCDRKVGDWLSGLGFLHECPVDKEYFWGRKNQIYCSPICKKRVAIDKLSEKNRKFGENIREYIRNAQILEMFYPKSQGKYPILIHDLRKVGFSDSGLFKLEKYKEIEKTWLRLGNYAYRLAENPQYVIIIKITDDGKH